MFWLLAGALVLFTTMIVLWPILKAPGKTPRYALVLITALGLPGLTLALYLLIGHWRVAPLVTTQNQSEVPADVQAMVATLAERLRDNGGSSDEWMMLGKSYMVLGRYAEAASAFQQGLDKSTDKNPDVLAQYAEALILSDRQQITGEAGLIFEQVLEQQPDNPRGLWYGGLRAFESARYDLAISRWQQLLNNAPQAGLRELLEERIADARLRSGNQVAKTDGNDAPIVRVRVAGDPQLLQNIAPATAVFVMVRDAPGSPPLAVRRMTVADLPFVLDLSDADAMLPTRKLSHSKHVEVVARIALGGTPVASPGDLFAAQQLDVSAGINKVSILIDRRVE